MRTSLAITSRKNWALLGRQVLFLFGFVLCISLLGAFGQPGRGADGASGTPLERLVRQVQLQGGLQLALLDESGEQRPAGSKLQLNADGSFHIMEGEHSMEGIWMLNAQKDALVLRGIRANGELLQHPHATWTYQVQSYSPAKLVLMGKQRGRWITRTYTILSGEKSIVHLR
ncbi:MAG: hypothetical protein D6730_01335 [Bacteroidetes bacterium]|nr:MAG: hypothetical protein D6730_01335 [Bacteroidota bacterium]